MGDAILTITGLSIHYPTSTGIVKAVDGVSFDIKRGQTLGVIGESGCGKSITARAILQMIPKPGKIVTGKVLYYRPVKGSN